MLPLRSLVMYKQKPAIVSAIDSDRIVVQTIDGEERRVRQKDLALAHAGPMRAFPSPDSAVSDVRDALELLAAEHPEGYGPMPWREFAELAWTDAGPDHIVRAWRALADEPSVELLDEGIRLRSQDELRALEEREQKRREITSLKSRFIEDFSRAWKHRTLYAGAGDGRYKSFIEELSRFARGLSDESALARAMGIKMEPHAVHEALIAAGVWDASFNPWPERNGCIPTAPSCATPVAERAELGIVRMDLRHLQSYAIDNEWSNDPDDAISIDGDTVWIHVADPASRIAPRSELDREAMVRGSTLYLPERTIPMLPEDMVRLLGLGLQDESPALSFGVRLDGEGRVSSTTITPSTVRVRRLTYQDADTMIESDDVLARLAAVARTRASHRRAHGAIDIEFPEVSIRARDGTPSFQAVPSTRSAGLVQELMILAGEAAARWAFERNLPFPYATQDPPASPKAAGSGEGPSPSLARNFTRRRSMRASIVSASCSAHAGLGLSFYSQVTSPLRRYQDLLAHYQIHAALAAERNRATSAEGESARGRSLAHSGDAFQLDTDAVEERLYTYSQQAAKNRQAERDSRAHWTMVHLSKNPGWEGNATVLDASENGPVIVKELGFETPIKLPRGIAADEDISIALRRVSIVDLSAHFDFVR